MQLNTIFYIIYSDTAITVLIVVALLFWDRRESPGAKYIALMMGSAALWGACDFVSDLIGSYSAKIVLNNLSFTGIIVIPAAWMIFVLKYIRRKKNPGDNRILLLFVIPGISFILTWTNNLHHLVFSSYYYVKTGELIILNVYFGPWFWIHATYSYFLFMVGIVLLFKKLVTMPSILRIQTGLILAAIIIPLVMNVLYTFGVSPLYPVDLTIFAFTFTGILCFFAMFRYKLFELIPAARNMVVENMNGVMVVLDHKNHIIDINSAARDLFSIDEDFLGKSVYEIIGEWSGYFRAYESVLRAEEKITVNVDGKKLHFDLQIVPLYDNRGRLNGRFITLYNITTLEEAIERLKESNMAAEAANKAKTEFLATMSHEIRTPLNGIIGMAELLASAQYTKEEKGYLDTVQTCATSLLDIVNDILDFSKIEAGKMELEKTTFNPKHLVESISLSFTHQVKESKIKFICNIDPAVPKALIGDLVRVRQILFNLVGNAFKFTHDGHIELKAELLQCEDRNAVLQFSVIDTGIGIPEDKMAILFKRFQQVDSSTTRKFGGTGLGLAIVKHLVNLMGGTIKVESTIGQGSSFFVTIPFQIADKDENTTASCPVIDFQGQSIRILLAEDNRANQMLIIKLLEMKKLDVDVVGNGKEVLHKMEADSFDLILMDIQMPEMDGLDAARAIREKELKTGKHIPIIALTANASEEDRKTCLGAGMDDYLTKPIRPEKLFECIHKHIMSLS